MDTKQEIVEMLRELAELTLLEDGDPQSFRVRAYESALSAVSAATLDFDTLDLKALQSLRGLGKSTAEKILELRATGRVAKLECLRQKYPPALVALLRLPGLGPKSVVRLQRELGILSIDDLKAAIADDRLKQLSGFGAKSQEKLQRALAHFAREGSADRHPIALAWPHARRIVAALKDVKGVLCVEACGSLRRFSETIGDLDIVVAARRREAVMDAFVRMSAVSRVIARGETKTSVVTHRGLQIDLRVVAEHQWGAALLYFTGSKSHNIKLRQRALSRGLTLNEYALSQLSTGKVIASESEQAIYAALGLCFVPPHLREDQGEIEAAERGALPTPLSPLLGDFHVHSSVSRDARSSLEDVVARARAEGYRVLAVTDHAEGVAPGVGRERLLEQRARVHALQRQLGDSLRLLHGVELNIDSTGALDYDVEFRRSFDFALASVHSHFELDEATQTQRVVRAMHDPAVRMIGHLSARSIGARPAIALDIDAVLRAASETGTALEVNGGLSRLDLSLEHLRKAKGRDALLVLTSDAHHESELPRIRFAATHAERAWIDPSQVVNTWSAERLRAWAEGKTDFRGRV